MLAAEKYVFSFIFVTNISRKLLVSYDTESSKPQGISTDFTCISRHLFEKAGFIWGPTFKHHVIRKNNAGLARSDSYFSLFFEEIRDCPLNPYYVI
jgi:hypothetical protein